MVKGLYLTLKIGPSKPTPVPREVIEALDRIQVQTTAGETASGFELKFNLGKRQPLDRTFLLAGESSPPSMIRVIIAITANGGSDTLMDGVMTHYELSPGSGSNPSILTIRGKDLTALMDYQENFLPFPSTSIADRVKAILSKYEFLGIEARVIDEPIKNVQPPEIRFPLQAGTDLEYIEELARALSYVFYIEPGPEPERSIAYFGPEVRVGMPQPPLNVDMDALTNVEALDFSFDDEAAEEVNLLYTDPASKVPTAVKRPDVSLVKPALSLRIPKPKKVKSKRCGEGLAKLSAGEVASQGLAEVARSSDAVTATGSLDVIRYGRILKARRSVSVRGAGEAFDGPYFVKSVTHNIKRGEYKQSFNLARIGLISSV